MQKLLLILTVYLVAVACNKSVDNTLTADFSINRLTGDSLNFVRFTDKSKGEYLVSEWDFGNGIIKNNGISHTIYYPYAGDYEVVLSVYSFDENDTAIKSVAIENSDLVIDFSVSVADTNINYVHLSNMSGTLDSFEWSVNNTLYEDMESLTVYFPFAGTYDIILTGVKNGISGSQEKKVSITRDDPEYINSFELVWSDEFEGTSLNSEYWSYETGATGWGNNELQEYTNGSNADVTDGKLIITAEKVNENTTVGSYTSSRIISRNKKSFTYGRMEIRARLPSGRGIWPAIWMLGSNISSVGWPRCGEIDIMEYVGYIPDVVHATIHTESGYGGNGSGTSIPLATCEEAFHNYGIIWTERYIKFYIDDPSNITYTFQPLIKSESNWPFNKPAFFILNIAVGGNWGGVQGIDNSIFPQTMEIDYIRVYQ
jgi:beta-glucanase (GH16 family)